MLQINKSQLRNDSLAVERVRALSRRIPFLYGLLAVNTIAVSITHFNTDRPLLTAVFPAVLLAIMLTRAATWKWAAAAPSDGDTARKTLRAMTTMSTLVAIAIMVWAMAIYPLQKNLSYAGGVTPHGQVVLFVGLTVICCISLLMHATATAVRLAVVVIVPFSVFLIIDGTLVEVSVAVNLFLVAVGMVYVALMFGRDFEEFVTSRNELAKMNLHYLEIANTDALTGLSNRRHFYDVLERTAASGTPFSVLIVDLDGFKQVNDLYGHPSGDLVLQEISHRIAEAYPVSICLARLGGDEFGILCGTTNTELLKQRAELILSACAQPVVIDTLVVSVAASIGIDAAFPAGDGAHASRHVERADYALTRAKRNGKGRVELFAQDHEDRIKRDLTIERALRVPTLADEISVAFQPIVGGRAETLAGFEALARWDSSLLGPVAPGEFVPIAERSDLVHKLTKIVLKKALAEAATWPATVRIKINLSARDMISPLQMIEIVAAVRQSKVNPRRITFELTETAFESDLQAIEASIALIKRLGCSLAIDDFGTGYSSLNYIHRLKPNVIKIDRSFVVRLCEPESSESIVRTIVDLCRSVGARSLAEGVETEAQRKALSELGIEEMQGYLFSKPLPVQSVRAWIANSIHYSGDERASAE